MASFGGRRNISRQGVAQCPILAADQYWIGLSEFAGSGARLPQLIGLPRLGVRFGSDEHQQKHRQ